MKLIVLFEFFGLVEKTFELVHASFCLSGGQAAKSTFFAS